MMVLADSKNVIKIFFSSFSSSPSPSSSSSSHSIILHFFFAITAVFTKISGKQKKREKKERIVAAV